MATVETIRAYHDQRDGVISTLNRARPLLNLRYVEAWPALFQMRRDLAAAMQAFQTFKHQKLFDPLIGQGKQQRMIAEHLKADCIKLGADYRDFQRKWSAAAVEACWPEYWLSAIAMMTTIRKAIADQDVIIRKLETLVMDRPR